MWSCSAGCSVFSSILGLYSLDDSNTYLKYENQKCLQTLSSGPWGTKLPFHWEALLWNHLMTGRTLELRSFWRSKSKSDHSTIFSSTLIPRMSEETFAAEMRPALLGSPFSVQLVPDGFYLIAVSPKFPFILFKGLGNNSPHSNLGWSIPIASPVPEMPHPEAQTLHLPQILPKPSPKLWFMSAPSSSWNFFSSFCSFSPQRVSEVSSINQNEIWSLTQTETQQSLQSGTAAEAAGQWVGLAPPPPSPPRFKNLGKYLVLYLLIFLLTTSSSVDQPPSFPQCSPLPQ